MDHPFSDKPVMSSTLKTITVLSLIGNFLQLIMTVMNFLRAKANYAEAKETIGKLQDENVPAIVRKMVGNSDDYMELMRLSLENKYPILILGLLASVLCLYGVFQMRALKKQGLSLYIMGELLPFLTMALFMNVAAFKGVMFYITVLITLLFILLYLKERRCLVYN
jgi:hypothetical protein